MDKVAQGGEAEELKFEHVTLFLHMNISGKMHHFLQHGFGVSKCEDRCLLCHDMK
jgi:hypothetical protein